MGLGVGDVDITTIIIISMIIVIIVIVICTLINLLPTLLLVLQYFTLGVQEEEWDMWIVDCGAAKKKHNLKIIFSFHSILSSITFESFILRRLIH